MMKRSAGMDFARRAGTCRVLLLVVPLGGGEEEQLVLDDGPAELGRDVGLVEDLGRLAERRVLAGDV